MAPRNHILGKKAYLQALILFTISLLLIFGAATYRLPHSYWHEHLFITAELNAGLLGSTLVEGVAVTGDTCGASLHTVKDALAQEHGSRASTRRYWFGGKWMDHLELYNETIIARFQKIPRDNKQGTICALASVKGEVPCVEEECVLTLHFRPWMSDFSVIKQLLERSDYAFIKPFRPATVLDAGANVGLATLIFGTFWPTARIISVEANVDNARMLAMNTRHLHNVVAVNAGLFNAVGKAIVFDDKAQLTLEGWKYRVKLAKDAGPDEVGDDIDIVTVDFLQRVFSLHGFDFAKIDIEGAEWEVFSQSPGYDPIQWINTTKLMAVELHDRMRPNVSGVVLNTMASLDRFRKYMSGEYVTFEDSSMPRT